MAVKRYFGNWFSQQSCEFLQV